MIEGAHGLAQLLGEPIRINWERVTLDAFDRLALKSYNTAVPGQASVHCMLELRKAHAIDPARVLAYQGTFDRGAPPSHPSRYCRRALYTHTGLSAARTAWTRGYVRYRTDELSSTE